MDSHELVEILKAANSYLSRLKLLDEELECAVSQINTTYKDTIQNITETFSSLRKNLIQVLNKRESILLNEAHKIQTQGLEPLEASQRLISSKIDSTNLLITIGDSVKNGIIEDTTKFSNIASLLGSLPEIPDLKDVPFITFCYEPSTEIEVRDIISDFGHVCPIAPVQIIGLTEKPGAIQIEWQNVDNEERLIDIQGFRLQRAFGNVVKEKHLLVNFKDCYRGLDTQFLVKDLQACQPYSFRVCCKFEGSSEWSPWSLPQVSSTCLKAFSWQPNEDYLLTNEGRIAMPLKDKPSLLISDGAQFSVGYSIEYTFLEVDSTDATIGLIAEDLQKSVSDFKCCKESSFRLNRKGKIFIDGDEKATVMPEFIKGLKVCVTCETVNTDKMRVNIDCDEKRVTYDWLLQPTTKMFFASQFESAKWKVMVE